MDTGATTPSPARKKPIKSLAAVVAIVLAVGVIGGYTTHFFDGGHKAAKAGPIYPKAWDPRIAPLAAIASKYRGLKYIHPVFVEFLSNKEFNKVVTTKDDDLSSADETSQAESEGIGRALGFFSGKVDLLQQSNQLNSSGILAFYSPEDKKIRIRGTKLTPAIKVTLVHELTHVLQDQHFDLTSTENKLDNSATEDGWAYHAIVEGDARRIQTEYQDSLPKAVQKQLNKADQAESNQMNKETKDVPPFLIADQQAPYDLGQVAVTRAARGGNRAVDALFTTPPIHEVQLMKPWLLGTAWTNHPFTEPTLTKGDKKIDVSEFGAYYLYLMLAERMPVQEALSIADGWGGDSALEYTHGKVSCAKIAFTGVDTDTTSRIYSGLRTWAAGMGGAATVTEAGATVNVNTCDPGTSFKGPKDQSLNAEQFVTFRNDFESTTEKEGATTVQAICFADGVANYFGESALTDASVSPAQKARIQSIALGCR